MRLSRLSIFEAAKQWPRKTFIIFNDVQYTFSDMANLVTKKIESKDFTNPLVLTACPTIETVTAILAALEKEILLTLLGQSETEDFVKNAKLETLKNFDQKSTGVMLFTSGTTSKPKGILLTRKTLMASAAASEKRVGFIEDDRWILSLPINHAGGLSIITRTLIAGKTVILTNGFKPETILKVINDNRATMFSAVPQMVKKILEIDNQNLLSRLRVLLIGGAFTPLDIIEECIKKNIRAFITYGMTETASQVATSSVKDINIKNGELWLEPLHGIEINIIDNNNRPLPDGEPGIISVKGQIVSNELITNDIGIYKNNRLKILGRKDNVIISGGENIHPEYIEQTLLKYEDIEDAIVFSIKDNKWGEAVSIALQIKDPKIFNPENFRQFCKNNLPSYAKPKYYNLTDKFHKLPNNKNNRLEIIKQAKNNLQLL
ncbi:MAG: AMP-binding protein [Deltaproteobacteria bacterium]|nr:AMP-binding protein [Deltaproteobacteria bacterium]